MTAFFRPLTGRHVLAMVLAFFTVVMGVNAIFAYIAISGFSGIETEDAYVKGLAYNETFGRRGMRNARSGGQSSWKRRRLLKEQYGRVCPSKTLKPAPSTT